MKKLLSLAALMVVPALAMVFATPAFADSPGQLSNGEDNYKVRNVTKNGAYGKSTSATCNETVKYSITLANSDYGLLTDLVVKANLASGAISASAKNAENNTTSVSGNVTVSVAKGTLKYVSGSTVRVSKDKQYTKLADGITTGGVNAGELNGSTYTFVQFEAKVKCDETPKEIEVCDLSTKKIVTIKESDYDSSKYTKDLSKCEDTPVTVTELPQTGSEGVVAIVAALLTAAVAYAVTARRNLLG